MLEILIISENRSYFQNRHKKNNIYIYDCHKIILEIAITSYKRSYLQNINESTKGRINS